MFKLASSRHMQAAWLLRLPYSFGAAFLSVKIKFIHIALKRQYFYLFHIDPIYRINAVDKNSLYNKNDFHMLFTSTLLRSCSGYTKSNWAKYEWIHNWISESTVNELKKGWLKP